MTPRLFGMSILVVACLCLYVNTWLTFNAGRIRKSGIHGASATDVLYVAAVMVANVTLWRMAAYPLLSVLVWLPLLAPLLLRGR